MIAWLFKFFLILFSKKFELALTADFFKRFDILSADSNGNEFMVARVVKRNAKTIQGVMFLRGNIIKAGSHSFTTYKVIHFKKWAKDFLRYITFK